MKNVIKDKGQKKLNIYNIVIIVICLILVIGCILYIYLKNAKSSTEEIVLETRANEIYEWKYEIEDESIVKFSEKTKTGDLENKTSKGLIEEHYFFKSVKSGKTKIKFTFTNTKNDSYGEIKYYVVKVDQDLKLTINELKNEQDWN